MGVTKEDVPDLRNSKSFDIIKFLNKKNHSVIINDPFVKDLKDNFKDFKNIQETYDAVVLAVPHNFYLTRINQIKKLLKKNAILFDIKGKLKIKMR